MFHIFIDLVKTRTRNPNELCNSCYQVTYYAVTRILGNLDALEPETLLYCFTQLNINQHLDFCLTV